MAGSAGTSRKRTPEGLARQATSLAGQTTFDEPFSDRAFHPHLSLEQRAALAIAARPPSIETPIPRVTNNRVKALCLFVSVFLIAASASFAVAYLRTRRATAIVSVPHILQEVPVRSVRLGMHAQAQDNRLVLSWDGNNPALQTATDGLLQIDDGPEHREMALDRSGITNASMVYSPISDDVVFRLEVRGTDGVRAAESLEVVSRRSRMAELETRPEPIPFNAGKVADRGGSADPPQATEQGSKQRNTAETSSEKARRASTRFSPSQPSAAHASSLPTVAMQKPPALSMSSVSAGQPSSFSSQELPKPPPEPSTTAIRENAAKDAIKRGDAADETAGQPSVARNMGYVPPRPIKWAAPSAKSLGASRASVPADFEIKVRIDESGHVTAAHALLDRTRHDEAVTAAVTAAVKQWIFEPAKMQGKNVASEETIVIRVDPRN